jgi:hypothetical protein
VDPTLPAADGGLAGALAAGCRAAGAALANRIPGGAGVELGAHAVCPLSRFPEDGVSSDADPLAGVVVPVRGPRPASAVVALEPGSALALVRGDARGDWAPGDGRRAIAEYVEAAGAVAAAIAAALLPGGDPGPAVLAEDSLPALLVGTHAPRSTLVVSMALLILRPDGAILSAFACLLVDAKELPFVSPRSGARPPG